MPMFVWCCRKQTRNRGGAVGSIQTVLQPPTISRRARIPSMEWRLEHHLTDNGTGAGTKAPVFIALCAMHSTRTVPLVGSSSAIGQPAGGAGSVVEGHESLQMPLKVQRSTTKPSKPVRWRRDEGRTETWSGGLTGAQMSSIYSIREGVCLGGVTDAASVDLATYSWSQTGAGGVSGRTLGVSDFY